MVQHHKVNFERGHEDKDGYDDEASYAGSPMFGLITLLMHQRYGFWAVSRRTYPGHFSFTKFLPEVFDRVDADERSDKKANQLDAAHQTNGYARQ